MANIESVTLLITYEQKCDIEKHYQNYKKDNKGEYIDFFAKKGKLNITIYTSKKENEYKIVFLGENALKEAKQFDENASINLKRNKGKNNKASWLVYSNQIGSDEVGTGDLFGPITVAASFVKEEDINYLKKLGVDDSKRLSDKEILSLGAKLILKIEYSQVALDNQKYNELVNKGYNLNQMKALMHNQVLKNLVKKHRDVKEIFIDQFVEKDKYYSYLNKEKEVVRNITFKTKGESYFPCVAVSSIIARYSFLKKMDNMNKKYNFEFPLGAGKKTTEALNKFAKKYGKKELEKVAKLNFANVKDLSD